MTLADIGTSESTVGAKKKPWLPRDPPVKRVAPFAVASSTNAAMADGRRALANGPITVPASRPFPT